MTLINDCIRNISSISGCDSVEASTWYTFTPVGGTGDTTNLSWTDGDIKNITHLKIEPHSEQNRWCFDEFSYLNIENEWVNCSLSPIYDAAIDDKCTVPGGAFYSMTLELNKICNKSIESKTNVVEAVGMHMCLSFFGIFSTYFKQRKILQ